MTYSVEEIIDKIFESDMLQKKLFPISYIFDIGASVAQDDLNHVKGKMNGKYGFWGHDNDDINERRCVLFRFKNVRYQKSDKYPPRKRAEHYIYNKMVEAGEGIVVTSKSNLGVGQETTTSDQMDESASYNFTLYIIAVNAKYPKQIKEKIRMGARHYTSVN